MTEEGEEPPRRETIDEFIARIEADEISDQKVATPVSYSKIRPVSSPQVYQWIRRGRLAMFKCICGRNVINIAEADELLRALGKLPPLEEPDPEDPYGYYEDRDETGREERREEYDNDDPTE
jgi:hypothetical protein